MASLRLNDDVNSFFCGGTLIHPRVVLTAGHVRHLPSCTAAPPRAAACLGRLSLLGMLQAGVGRPLSRAAALVATPFARTPTCLSDLLALPFRCSA